MVMLHFKSEDDISKNYAFMKPILLDHVRGDFGEV